MANEKLYFGGIPTDIDVRALREAFPESGLKVGQLIPYAAVEAIVKTPKDSCRFKTITGRWRRLVERDSEIILGAEKGQGFRVLDNSEKLELWGTRRGEAWRGEERGWARRGSARLGVARPGWAGRGEVRGPG